MVGSPIRCADRAWCRSFLSAYPDDRQRPSVSLIIVLALRCAIVGEGIDREPIANAGDATKEERNLYHVIQDPAQEADTP